MPAMFLLVVLVCFPNHRVCQSAWHEQAGSMIECEGKGAQFAASMFGRGLRAAWFCYEGQGEPI